MLEVCVPELYYVVQVFGRGGGGGGVFNTNQLVITWSDIHSLLLSHVATGHPTFVNELYILHIIYEYKILFSETWISLSFKKEFV